MASHNLAYLKIGELEILGYSVAGEETVVGMPQLDVCFDIGKAPDQVIPINNVLLTHGHMDHAAGIAYYLSHRKFCGLSAGRLFVPVNLLKPIREIVSAWGRLDGSAIDVELVGVKAGDEYQIKPNLYVRVFPTKHCRGSVGYSVIEKRKKLREEYLGLTGQEIVELKEKGVEIDYTLEVPIVSYLGDTQYAEFDSLDYVRDSKILIAECTFFLEEHMDRAEAGKHMHIDEFAELMKNMNNEYIIVTHLTQRMGIGQAKQILKKKLAKDIFDKVILLMDKRRGRKVSEDKSNN